MPFVRKTDAQSHQPPTDAKKLFIGRTNELHFFLDNILKPDEPTHNILSISGQGGVGKTTLLNRYIEESHATTFKDYCLTALVDDHQTTPVNIMERFADQLHISGEFEKALSRYKDALRKLQSEREATRDTVLRKATTEAAGSVVKSIPFVGGMLNQGVELAVDQIWDEVHYRHLLKDAERLEDPIGDLTKAFVNELNALAATQITLNTERTKRKRRVLLLFDTFEQLATEIAPWLLDYFLPTDINSNIVLVIAGRTPLERSTPDDPKRWLPYQSQNVISQLSLEEFTEDETRNYLTERGIIDTSHIQTIWKLSLGLPLYLALLTSNPQGTVDPTADVVANFLRWIPDQEQSKRQLVLDAALLSRPFNQDELAAFPYLSDQERPLLYRWLRSQPFIRSNPQDGRQTYHELAQELFSRHLNHLSPSNCQATRRSLAEYYRRQLKHIEAEGGKDIYHTPQWLELTLALVYQLFLLPDEASHIQAIEQILNASKHEPQKEEIIRVLRSLSQEQQTSQITASARQAAKQLLRCIEADKEDKEVLVAFDYLLEKVTHHPLFSKEALASIYDIRGDVSSNLKEYQQAIADYGRAIQLNPSNAVYYFNRGRAYSDQKEYQQAIANYDRAIELDPKYVVAYNRRGVAYFNLKEYQQAIADFDHAINLDPKNAVYYVNRGHVYSSLEQYQQAVANYDHAIDLNPKYALAYNRRGNVYFSQKEYQQAIADCNRAIELDPNNAVLYSNRGITYSNLKEYQQAIVDYDRAIELDPNNAVLYLNRGITYSNLKEYQQAIADYDRAIELDPKYTLAYNRRGNAYFNLKEYQQAIADYDRAIELDPSDADYYYNRGRAYTNLKEYQQAIADYDRAIELDPNNAVYYYNRGNAYSDLKEYQQAIADYNRAIELDPSDADYYYNRRGNAYSDLKEYQQAIADYNRAIELDPNNAVYYFNRGRAYSDQKEYQQAIADYNRAIELDPKYTLAYNRRSNAYFDLKEYQQAIADCARAIELDPNNALLYSNRGITYSNLKEYQQAIADYNRAIELDPSDADCYCNRGHAYFNLKEYQQAIADYDRAIELDPNNALAYNRRGITYSNLKEYQQAIANYDRVIDLNPNNAVYYSNRGRAYTNLKEYQQAIVDYTRALELDPNLTRAYANRGFTYLWLKDISRALADYIRSWELDSTNIYRGWRIEWLRMCQERPSLTAAEKLEAVAAVDPQHYVAHVCLGVALWIRGSFEQALTELKLAVPLDQEEWNAYFWQGMAYASLERDEEAIAAIEKSLQLDLPSVLLAPLRWFEQDRPGFYEKYAVPLLTRYDI